MKAEDIVSELPEDPIKEPVVEPEVKPVKPLKDPSNCAVFNVADCSAPSIKEKCPVLCA